MSIPVDEAEREAIRFFYNRTGHARTDVNRLSSPRRRTAKTLQDHWTLMRAAGVLAEPETMLRAAAEARAMIAQMRKTPVGFDAQRRTLAYTLLDQGRPGYGVDDVLRFLPPNLPAPAMRRTAARLLEARKRLGPLFGPIHRYLEGAGPLQALETADLGLIAPLHILAQPEDGDTDLPATLLRTLATTAELAAAAGLTVSLIPDYLFCVLQRRPAHVFSFHTAGQFPGFVHFKKADLPDYMVIDAGGYSGWSSVSGRDLASLDLPPLEEAKAACQMIYRDVVLANVSKYRQPETNLAEAPLPARYVFVALQGPLIDAPHLVKFSTKAMLQLVVDRFAGTDVAVVVKLHPKVKDPNMIGWLIGLAETGAILLRDDSIHTLASRSDAVMTINSGVGSEVMIHRKPIYCFGASDYDAIAHRITSVEQFHALTTPIRPAVSDDDLVRFIAYYRRQYLVDRGQPGRFERALQERVIAPALRSTAS